MTSNDATAAASTAIVLHNNNDDREISQSSSSIAVVLDALPYVEPLDPNYEHYALSLIEEELQDVVTEHRRRSYGGSIGPGDDENVGEHPSLRRILTASANIAGGGDDIVMHTPDFGGRAPLATAAYEALAAKRRRAVNAGDEDDSGALSAYPPFFLSRPDPMAEEGSEEADRETLLSHLQTSIATSKIRLEQERLRLVNLELHQHFETPARYTAYASKLESKYLNPTIQAVERQRRTVDGINATRMEEQTSSIGKLEGMARKWELLVEKNRRLGKALVGLEREVESLKEAAKEGEASGGEETSMRAAEMSGGN